MIRINQKIKRGGALTLFAISAFALTVTALTGTTKAESQSTDVVDEHLQMYSESTQVTGAEYRSLGLFTLTAYCPCVRCCGVWSVEHPSRIGTGYIQKTASGTIPAEGRTIGVDPNVIPFGTAVMINGHEYVAEDRGGAVRGNSIDVFFYSHNEALEFGRQTAEVFIKTTKED